MAFIVVGGSVVSYAEAVDVRSVDQRVFEANEIDFTNVPDNPGSLDNYIEDLTTKATDRINQKIRSSARWREYLGFAGSGYDSLETVPAFDPDKIITRKQDFTDLCAYATLYMYILPKIADFGNPESSEVQKIQYFEKRFNDLFEELMNMMDWYDDDGDGTVQDSEKMISYVRTRRTRGRKGTARVN